MPGTPGGGGGGVAVNSGNTNVNSGNTVFINSGNCNGRGACSTVQQVSSRPAFLHRGLQPLFGRHHAWGQPQPVLLSGYTAFINALSATAAAPAAALSNKSKDVLLVLTALPATADPAPAGRPFCGTVWMRETSTYI